MADEAVRIRAACVDDVPAVFRLVRDLAAYENLPVTATEEDLRAALFGLAPCINAILAERRDRVIGVAVWFTSFSTFAGRPNIYIEDVFVEPAHRGGGVARMLFRHLARLAVADGYGRLEWSVLNSNAPAWRFYQSIGAVPVTEWTLQRLAGPALAALAASEDEPHG